VQSIHSNQKEQFLFTHKNLVELIIYNNQSFKRKLSRVVKETCHYKFSKFLDRLVICVSSFEEHNMADDGKDQLVDPQVHPALETKACLSVF
jgi:hypothetical protein